MYGRYVSIHARPSEELMKKAEKRVFEDKEKLAQNIVDYYFKKNLPLIPPPKLVFKEKPMARSLDEIAKKITPDGMYVYLEQDEDEADCYRLHMHTGKMWVSGTWKKHVLEDESAKVWLGATNMWGECGGRGTGESEEFPRQCAEKREMLRSILENIIGEDGDDRVSYLQEFSKRMGVNPGAYTWDINPPGQIKSIQVLQDMVNEEIGKRWVPEASRGARKLELQEKLELAGNGGMFDSISGINSIARGQPEASRGARKLELNVVYIQGKDGLEKKCCGNPKDHVPDGIACWKYI